MDFACAINAGKIYCWGNNTDLYSLFDLAPGNYVNPVEITSAGSDNVKVTIGRLHGCVIKTDKTVWCTGYNGSGSLGLGDTVNRTGLVQVPGVTNVDELITSSYGTCARSGASTLKCWGQYAGTGSASNTLSPFDVTGFTNITAIRGGYHRLCLIDNGAAYCWGFNRQDQFGRNDYLTNDYHFAPVALTSLNALGAVTDIEPRGAYGLCGKVGTNWYCSGMDVSGQLGTDKKPFRLAPISVGPLVD
ncbi:RCC1 domain-containing protein [Bdellovibrio bacteriovorus]|uniref:RCC1 domain-containing protein n=2 Tax=Bdellovibrio TaxID=958 RepID=UPI0035A69058